MSETIDQNGGKYIMNEIINLDELRLSKLDHDELLVESIERMSKWRLSQTILIKELTGRIEELEENVKERENEIDDIFRILNAT